MRPLETISYEETDEVARVRLVRSRIDMAMIRELTWVCDHLDDTSPCSVVVIEGAGADFSLGIDFAEFKPDTPMDIHGFNKWEKICSRIERLPKATIAALRGRAVGGGAQLALVCDARLATADATLHFNEVKLGFLPGMATFRLAKYVGLGQAKRLLMRCPVIGAKEAVRLGILDDVVVDLDDGVKAVIAELQPVHPVAVELARRLLNESFATSWEDGIGNFLAAQHRAISQTEFLESVRKAQRER